MARTWTWYCVCGCAQEVPEEGTYASEECEESPEIPFPPAQSSGETWQSYLDSLR